MSNIIFTPSTGTLDKSVSISSSVNEGIDTSEQFDIKDESGVVSERITVNQVGKREVFQVMKEDGSGYEDFLLADDEGTFNVLKEGIR